MKTINERDADMIESIEMWLHEIEPKWVEKELTWLGDLRTRLAEEPVSDCHDLKEEVKRYYSENFSYITSDNPTLSILTNIARHFVQWGAEHTPLPEDTVIFQKGVEEGKRLMMEGAVAVEVVGEKRDLRLIDSTQRCLFDAKRGDWLKIIIVKEEEQ